jgi:hypothetical protein
MAQPRVSEFFAAKKRSSSVNPAKRRKVELTEFNDDLKSAVLTPSLLSSAKDVADQGTKTLTSETCKQRSTRSKAKQTPASTSAKTRSSARNKADQKNHFTIKEASARQSESLDSCSDVDGTEAKMIVGEDVTTLLQWDECDGPTPKTPKRKTRPCDTLRLFSEGDTTEAHQSRRKLLALRSLEDHETPSKTDNERVEKQQHRQSELALSFKQKWAQAEEMVN